jgi:hypothetical protein
MEYAMCLHSRVRYLRATQKQCSCLYQAGFYPIHHCRSELYHLLSSYVVWFQQLFWITQSYLLRTVNSCFPVKEVCVFKCWIVSAILIMTYSLTRLQRKTLLYYVTGSVFWLSVVARSWSLQLVYVARIQTFTDLSEFIPLLAFVAHVLGY